MTHDKRTQCSHRPSGTSTEARSPPLPPRAPARPPPLFCALATHLRQREPLCVVQSLQLSNRGVWVDELKQPGRVLSIRPDWRVVLTLLDGAAGHGLR
jgi:hypothetical protein